MHRARGVRPHPARQLRGRRTPSESHRRGIVERDRTHRHPWAPGPLHAPRGDRAGHHVQQHRQRPAPLDRRATSTPPSPPRVLCVSAFVLTLAVAMPLIGWLGDRFGQKQTLVLSLLLMLVAQAAAALVTNLGQLIVLRGVQGLACAAIPPMVMGLLSGFYPSQRTRVMGAWAAANGIGQAIGPPVGGLISDWVGWRVHLRHHRRRVRGRGDPDVAVRARSAGHARHCPAHARRDPADRRDGDAAGRDHRGGPARDADLAGRRGRGVRRRPRWSGTAWSRAAGPRR